MQTVPVKKGDVVICENDESDDEAFGSNTGIVLEGRTDLKIGREYVVESVNLRHVPKNKPQKYQEQWIMIKLHGIDEACWYKDFKLKT